MAIGVEEVGAAQVIVTIGDAGVDARHLDDHLDARHLRMLAITGERGAGRF
jgi:amino acid permease